MDNFCRTAVPKVVNNNTPQEPEVDHPLKGGLRGLALKWVLMVLRQSLCWEESIQEAVNIPGRVMKLSRWSEFCLKLSTAVAKLRTSRTQKEASWPLQACLKPPGSQQHYECPLFSLPLLWEKCKLSKALTSEFSLQRGVLASLCPSLTKTGVPQVPP